MDGIIIVNKEPGYTSHDVIAILRGILRIKKIGHTGTLDPGASGVLPVCIGKATKAAALLTAMEKEYEAEMVFGYETDTQDVFGEKTRQTEYAFSEETFYQAAREMTGEIEQIPPMYSALKVNGIRLYDLAREGIEVERKPRAVRIEEIQVLGLSPAGARIRVRCSKGTYIRTLCEDIGRKTGWLASMASLKRLRSGPFTLEQSLSLEGIHEKMMEGRIEYIIRPVDRLFEAYPAVTIAPEQEKRLQNGNTLCFEKQGIAVGTKLRIYNSQSHFAALYEAVEESGDAVICKAYKMF